MMKKLGVVCFSVVVASISAVVLPAAASAQTGSPQTAGQPETSVAPDAREAILEATQKLANMDASEIVAFLADPTSLLSSSNNRDTLETRTRALAILSPEASAKLIALVMEGKTDDAQSGAIGTGLGRASTVLSTSPVKEVRDLAQAIQAAAAQVKNLAFQRAYAIASGDDPTGALAGAGAAAGAGNIAAGNSANGINGGNGAGGDGGNGAFVQSTTSFAGASSGLTSGGGGGSSTTILSVNSISSL